jgi:ABC-type cobalamin/Fe3+-siderophores transport system ATPase subunit
VWETHSDNNDNDFQPLVNLVVGSKKSFNILGRAGCGKSTLIKAIQKKLKKQNKKYITLCPTNKGCVPRGRFAPDFSVGCTRKRNARHYE